MKARKIMEAPQPACEMRVRVCAVSLSKTGLCGQIASPPKPGPHQLEARQPALRTEVWAFSELLGSG